MWLSFTDLPLVKDFQSATIKVEPQSPAKTSENSAISTTSSVHVQQPLREVEPTASLISDDWSEPTSSATDANDESQERSAVGRPDSTLSRDTRDDISVSTSSISSMPSSAAGGSESVANTGQHETPIMADAMSKEEHIRQLAMKLARSVMSGTRQENTRKFTEMRKCARELISFLENEGTIFIMY